MSPKQLGKPVQLILIALATLVMTTASSLAGPITINFLELSPDETGIRVTGTDVNGNAITVPDKLGAETYRISAPGCTAISGCNPDTTLGGIGTATEYLVNILESAGGPISDQVWVHRISSSGGSQVIDF